MSALSALVTGVTSGIGKTTAEPLRSRCYRVVVSGVGDFAGAGCYDGYTTAAAQRSSSALGGAAILRDASDPNRSEKTSVNFVGCYEEELVASMVGAHA